MQIKIDGKHYYEYEQMCKELGYKDRKSLYDAVKRGEIKKIHLGSVFRKV